MISFGNGSLSPFLQKSEIFIGDGFGRLVGILVGSSMDALRLLLVEECSIVSMVRLRSPDA